MPRPKSTKSAASTPFTECPCVGATLDKLIQPAMLAMLADEPLHGYELARRIGNIPGFLDEPPDMSGIYRMLKLLESRGLVVADWDVSQGGRTKRVFTITDAGRHCLKLWNQTLRQYRQALDALLEATHKAPKH